jgi:hypothetical protein
MANSADVTANVDTATAAQYNNLRKDVLDNTTGHNHNGTDGRDAISPAQLFFKAATELTISSGDITSTQSFHSVDTESDASTDDLAGINGGAAGEFLLLRPTNDARTIVVKHNGSSAAADNILLADDTDFTMDRIEDFILLFYDATLDTNGAWCEISRSIKASELADDLTPVLGAALDAGGFDINNGGVIFLTEQGAAEADVAGKGQVWVKTATPNVLFFTDDAGTDFAVVTPASVSTFTNKTIDQDATGNNITNIANASVKAAAAIALNKLAALTASQVVISDASGFLVSAAVATYPSLTEFAYVKGVTSAIQTQINAAGGALARASGTTTEATTTSTTVAELIAVTSLTIAATSPIQLILCARKTTGAGSRAGLGLYMNETSVAGASVSGEGRFWTSSAANSAEAGLVVGWIGSRVTNYIMSGAGIEKAVVAGASAVLNLANWNISNGAPTGEITDVDIWGDTTSSVTLGADEYHIYTMVTS